MKITQTITPATRTEWRRWLKKNHQLAPETWLIFYKKHTGKKCIGYDDAVEEALCFGWIDGIVQTIDADRYGQRFTPRRAGSKWSELNRLRAKRLIASGKMTEAGKREYLIGMKQRLPEADVQKRESLVVPEYLKKALKQNEAAQKNFAALPSGYKRMAVRWITTAKKKETQERRVEEFVRLTAFGKRIGLK